VKAHSTAAAAAVRSTDKNAPLPGRAEVIERPMDLGTVLSKLQSGEYASAAAGG
jgi:hypothetical protein